MTTLAVILFINLASQVAHQNHHCMIPGISIEEKTISKPKFIIGKDFTGSFENTSKYLNQVKAELDSNNIAYNEFEAVSIYFSDPSIVAADQLKSYHGFVTNEVATANGLMGDQLESGKYLVTSTQDVNLVWAMFEGAYTFAAEKNIRLVDRPPMMITTVADNKPLFSLYFRML